MKKKLLALMMVLAMIFAFAACGGSESEEPAEEAAEEVTTEEAEATGSDDIIVDEEAGTVTLTAVVNGTYFNESTMHCIVFKDGGAAGIAMFKANADSQDFYNALVSIGAEPWNTTDAKLEEGDFTDGDKLDVTLTWDGQDEPVALADVLKTGDGERPEIDIRFSGNQQNNAEAGSGCVTCLNSCWAGVSTNAAYAFGAIDSGNPTVFLDETAAPADGTEVTVTYTLVK